MDFIHHLEVITTEHDVSENGVVSVFRREEGETYFVGSITKIWSNESCKLFLRVGVSPPPYLKTETYPVSKTLFLPVI
jgi:hypothetical protein